MNFLLKKKNNSIPVYVLQTSTFIVRIIVSYIAHGQCSKAKGWIDFSSFLMLNDLEEKIFQYGFLEGHNV